MKHSANCKEFKESALRIILSDIFLNNPCSIVNKK